MHKFNNLKSSYHFLKNFLVRCARSIAFYPSLTNENMQCALPTPFIFWGVTIIPDSFQNSLKPRINCTKLRIQCPKIVCGGCGRKLGGRENGGKSAMVVRGDRRPCGNVPGRVFGTFHKRNVSRFHRKAGLFASSHEYSIASLGHWPGDRIDARFCIRDAEPGPAR